MFFRIPDGLVNTSDKVYILQTKVADVNGDGVDETLILTGKKPYGENGFVEDLTLTIENKKTGVNIIVKPKENSGFDPNLFVGRFQKNTTPQVFLSIASGGSANYYFNYIYSFKNNISKLIFDFDKFNDENEYSAIYENYYKVRVKSINGKLEGLIDLTAIRDKEYLSNIYDSNGKLKKPEIGGVLSLSYLSPLSLNGSEIFSLLTNQRIIGLYNSDILGAVESILQWDKDKFTPVVTRLVVNM
ncbi:hypothetical protein BD780_000738 [Clostridium tetanomorphum]|uniref:Spore coat protein n=1 Tax=Clostridium tetanomorphum TaxID=1553 RepID=A0A923J042_CLOTT|nr:hypothetical protein [Clostridium tetanomorphum]KAJ50988.1 hypothetical protein CTM_15233 [Clostridium tetanomorphum DSM 665]MBC2396355.1 hypothetical protein [Clostridium tetanomorphum]MBP1863416.1 hypothetical protein [Clostridium tetanomorphum]NRS83513.1 hypothetical protein [Clostridium tetanomorphum]NRZ96713.1 hypothetical protein [Clostridium tetanomorphum]